MNDLTTWKRRALRSGSVRGARSVRELTLLVRALSRSVLFDREAYEHQRGRRFPGAAAAAYDYVVVGSRLGLAAGPLLLAPVPAAGRRSGVGPAAAWAARVRAAGFPRTTAHPLVDLAWYQKQQPDSGAWPGGPLAHYTSVGRGAGARLGPLDPGTADLVEVGRDALLAPSVELSSAPVAIPAVVGLVAVDGLRSALPLGQALLAAGLGLVILPWDDAAQGEALLARAALLLVSDRVVLTADAGGILRDPAVECAVVATAPVAPEGDCIDRLVDHVRAGGVDVVAPVLLEADDTVHDAGIGGDGSAVLAGWPWADAARRGLAAVPGVSGVLAALGPRALGRLDHTLDLRAAVSAVSLSAAERGEVVRVDGAVAARLLRVSATDQIRSAPYADPATSALRWAIKSPHPAGPRRSAWGDFHFATALAAALERLGHHVAVDPLDSWHRATARYDDVTLTLRGLHRYRPAEGQLDLLWVISHPELLEAGELDDFDHVLAASRSWARAQSRDGRPVLPLLQCTDADRFRPDVAEPGSGEPLLFVGNSRQARRPLVEAAAEADRGLAVYGGGWDGRLPAGVLRGEHVDNAELPALYRAAGVVLNDHWPDMAELGFLSNRLFDLTAAGARWVSDPATDLLDVFPTGRVAADRRELEELLDASPASLPTEGELLAASEDVRLHHSFDARARELDALVRAELDRRPT